MTSTSSPSGRRQAPHPRLIWADPRDAAAPRAPAASRLFPLLAIDADTVFAFLIFMVLLFTLQLGTAGAALLVLLVPAYAVMRREQLLELALSRALLLVVPALVVCSVVWSEARGESAKLAFEFCLTIMVGLLFSAARNPYGVFRSLAAAFFIYVCVSMALGHQTAVGNNGEQAFSGLSDGKNLLGDIAATGVLLSLGVAADGLRRQQAAPVVLALGAALIEFYTVMAAHSAGAVLGLAFGLMALFGLTAIYRSGLALRAILVGFLCLCLTIGAVSFQWLSTQLIELGASLFDKDTTLTGRTYLWYRADQLIAEKPALGRGFYAFWIQGNVDAEGLWRYAGITGRGGFTFHNTGVEILVQLGWVGLVTIAVVALTAMGLLLARFVRRPSLALCIWMSLLLYELVRTPIEAIGLAPFYFSTVLVFAGFGVAFAPQTRPLLARAAAPRAPRPRDTRYRLLDPTPAAPRRLLALPAPPKEG